MAQNIKLMVMVNDDLYTAIKTKVDETGIPYSVVARRALENWVATGVMPARVASPGKAEAVPAVGNGEG